MFFTVKYINKINVSNISKIALYFAMITPITVNFAKSSDLLTTDVTLNNGKWHTPAECPLEIGFGSSGRDDKFKVNIKSIGNPGRVSRNNTSWTSAAYFYKSEDCPNPTKDKPETLYVIDPNGSFYFVNVCSDSRTLIEDNFILGSFDSSACVKQEFDGAKSVQTLRVVHSLIIGKLVNRSQKQVLGPVAGAGIVYVNRQSKISAITSCSGHYKPTRELFNQTVKLVIDSGAVAEGNVIEKTYYCRLKDQECYAAIFDPADQVANEALICD